MKHLKMLGLAAIAALGLMAFVGASSASATTLFTSSNLTNPYAAGTTIEASLPSGSTSILTGSGGEVLDTCTGSSIVGSTLRETGPEISSAVSSLTWSGCTVTTDTVTVGSFSIGKTGTNEGWVLESLNQVTINIFGVSCVYTPEGGPLGTITGGVEPILHINAAGLIKTGGGFLCPNTAAWDAEYRVMGPHAIFIGA